MNRENTRRIRPLELEDVDSALRIKRDAYPAAPFPPLEDHRAAMVEDLEFEDVHASGVFDDERMVGVLRTFDFVMNVFGKQLPVSGLGGVAVGLCDKKNKVARDLVHWFLEQSHAAGCALTSLYPFRASFYQRMGFGTGAPMHRFHLLPSSVPFCQEAPDARFLYEEDRAAIAECHARVQARRHGLFQLGPSVLKQLHTHKNIRVIGVEVRGRLEAYMSFLFEPLPGSNPLKHNLTILNWTHESSAGLRGVMNFLHKQADQVHRVWLMTQDSHLQHLFEDPLDESGNFFHIHQQISQRGTGVMYRLIDPARFFEQVQDHCFGGVDLAVDIDLRDGFWGRTSVPFKLVIEGGKARVSASEGASDARPRIGIGDFTSMILGVLPLGRLIDYGLAELNDENTRRELETAFLTPEPPVCDSRF